MWLAYSVIFILSQFSAAVNLLKNYCLFVGNSLVWQHSNLQAEGHKFNV